jgi:hypothetical protein
LTKTLLQLKQPDIKQGLPVIKKTLLTEIILMALLFSAVAGTQFVNLGTANPQFPYVPGGEIRPEQVDAEPPVITILPPQNNSVTEQGNITLSISATSGNVSGDSTTWISTIRYETDWLQDDVYVYVYGYIELPPVLTLTGINGTRIPEGTHSVTVYANEKGQYRDNTPRGEHPGTLYTFTIEGSSTVFFTVDRTSPIVSVLLLENKTYGKSFPLNFTVNESVSNVKYSLDGLNNVTVAGNATLTGLSNGNHNVTVYATDEAGNTGATETIYFSVEEPFPLVLVIAASVSIATISIGLLVYFKKRKH